MKLILIAAVLVAAASAFDEATFTEQSDEDVLLAVKTSVDAMMNKGAKESDCLDLAKTSCKEVERERSTNQGMLNKLSTGSDCPAKGQKDVTRTKNHYLNQKKKWDAAKATLHKAKNARVSFSNQKYNSMKRGDCRFIFSSRSYLDAKKKLNNAIQQETYWKGMTSGAHKAWQTQIKIAAKRRHNCHCDAQVTASNTWNTVGNSKLLKKQNRAHLKCKMMSCVLKGTKTSAPQCQASLATLRNKVLTAATRRENCRGHKVNRKAWTNNLLPGLAQNNKHQKNTWSGWYNKGNNGYSKVKLDKVKFTCGNQFVEYNLNGGYKGKTLVDIVRGCGIHAGSRNNGQGRWRSGHCSNVGSLVKSSGVNGATNLRIGVGDNSNDAPDWAVFMLVSGNGRGDFHGYKIWDFGGETQMNDARQGKSCTISGYGA